MNSPSVARSVAVLVLIAVAIRVGVFFVYRPATYQDSGTYFTLASQILALDFSEYKGIRTPGYSVLLMLGGQVPGAVWLLQSVLGVLISLLLFWICYTHTRNTSWSLVAGLLHALALNQLFFEPAMLSETLATFLVVLSAALFLDAVRNRGSSGYGVGAGLAAAVTTLTRPLYVYLGPLFIALDLMFERGRRRMAAVLAVAFFAPVVGWMAFNKAAIDYFGLATLAGYNITNQSGRFMEDAGDEYAVIRDVYLKYRKMKIEQTNTYAMTIFWARREMLEKTGLDEVALSRQLSKLSLELIVTHPLPYLRSVAEAWVSFWPVPFYALRDSFTVPAAARTVFAIWPLERALLLAANFLAIAASGWVLASAVVRRLKGVIGISAPLVVSSVVMAASVLQALVEYGENARYAIPTQSLAVTLVLLAAWDLYAAYRARSARGTGIAGGRADA